MSTDNENPTGGGTADTDPDRIADLARRAAAGDRDAIRQERYLRIQQAADGFVGHRDPSGGKLKESDDE